ncbi:hypothetical protein KSP39_PZI023802 [Platanthera zijinensis]|uniref:Uncharacterized protein n=1 Tax=Platanthera zijinensis TaxID=2320716 RepID=A0AAP0ASC7_9ASPA
MNPVEKNAGANRWKERGHASTAWGALLFGVIGVTITTAALPGSGKHLQVHRNECTHDSLFSNLQVFQLRKSVSWIYTEGAGHHQLTVRALGKGGEKEGLPSSRLLAVRVRIRASR